MSRQQRVAVERLKVKGQTVAIDRMNHELLAEKNQLTQKLEKRAEELAATTVLAERSLAVLEAVLVSVNVGSPLAEADVQRIRDLLSLDRKDAKKILETAAKTQGVSEKAASIAADKVQLTRELSRLEADYKKLSLEHEALERKYKVLENDRESVYTSLQTVRADLDQLQKEAVQLLAWRETQRARLPAVLQTLQTFASGLLTDGSSPLSSAPVNPTALLGLAASLGAFMKQKVDEAPVRVKCPAASGPGTPGEKCCERAGEYNGFGSDGPTLFTCPKTCSCHD